MRQTDSQERTGGHPAGAAPTGCADAAAADMPRQLALPFAHQPRFERADFLAAGSNESALAWLGPGGGPAWPSGRLALWGEAGSGKTHLLHVWAREHDALLLPGTALRELDLLFRAPGRWGGVAVDDADAAADEPALLHLLNAAHESRLPVLLTARSAPARWPVALPDLRSRLRATHSVELGRPDATLLRILLMRLLVERQLGLTLSVIDWLMPRLPRTAAAMREVAGRLDRAALASGRRMTRALAAAVLSGMLDEEAVPAAYAAAGPSPMPERDAGEEELPGIALL